MVYDLSAVFNDNCGKLNSYILSKAFTALFDNDNELMTNSDYIPNVWECKWFNDSVIPGYSKGYTVWVNGLYQNDYEFLTVYGEKLYNYIKNNDQIFGSNIYFKYSWKDSLENREKYYYTNDQLKEISSLYIDVAYGRYTLQIDTNTQKHFQAIFNIGTTGTHNNTVIYVSLKDNNQDDLSADSWRKINIETEFSDYVDLQINNIFEEHVDAYHNNLDPNANETDLKSKYVMKDLDGFSLSNIQNQNLVQTHTQYINSEGFDIVNKYIVKYDDDISSATMPVKLNRWFRLWNSGYLEHGGIIKCDSTDVSNYLYTVDFDWEYEDEDGTILSAPIYNYDRIDEDYIFELSGQITSTKDMTFYSETNNIYLNYTKDLSILYTNDDHLDIDRDSRYTITLTPYRFNENMKIDIDNLSTTISSIYGNNKLLDDSIIVNEVHHIYNKSFSFTDNNLGLTEGNKDKPTKYYCYYCTGFVAKNP